LSVTGSIANHAASEITWLCKNASNDFDFSERRRSGLF